MYRSGHLHPRLKTAALEYSVWSQTGFMSLTSCVTLGKFPNLSEPPFSHGNNSAFPMRYREG